jgi:hypothetical protein
MLSILIMAERKATYAVLEKSEGSAINRLEISRLPVRKAEGLIRR